MVGERDQAVEVERYALVRIIYVCVYLACATLCQAVLSRKLWSSAAPTLSGGTALQVLGDRWLGGEGTISWFASSSILIHVLSLSTIHHPISDCSLNLAESRKIISS